MFANYLDGSTVNFLVAFIAGIVTFFASCLLPLVPTYLAYLSGIALNSPEAGHKKWQVFKTALLFVIGFVLTFTLLGFTLNKLSPNINSAKEIVAKIAGILFIILGLFMLGLFKNQLLAKEIRSDFHHKFIKHKNLHALLTGIAFGFGWTPCIGPVLAVILFWSTRVGSVFKGSLLLLTYGLGLGVPFLLLGLGFEKLIPLLKKYKRISQFATYLSGGLVLAAGILLLFGQFQQLSLWLIHILKLQTLTK